MSQVGGKAVTQVNHGARQVLLAQDAAQFDARLRIEGAGIIVRLQLSGFPFLCQPAPHLQNGGGRSAQFSADENTIARACAGAQHSLPSGRSANDDNIRKNAVGRFRRIAARQRDAVFFRQTEQATNEASHPGLGQVARQGKRKKGRNRLTTHGGNIAQTAGQTPVADRFRRMPVATEMNAFQREVGGDQRVVSRQQTQYGAVVSNSGENLWGADTPFDKLRAGSVRLSSPNSQVPVRPRHTANLGNQRFFGKRHRRNQYKPRRDKRCCPTRKDSAAEPPRGARFPQGGGRVTPVTCPMVTSAYPVFGNQK